MNITIRALCTMAIALSLTACYGGHHHHRGGPSDGYQRGGYGRNYGGPGQMRGPAMEGGGGYR
ncbi:hypothetical protein DY926_11360 [Komagataeibacter melaceti]|uniref:Lipoprotein n=1 Tax=Komagataeibacter melaceti TaxID=2766577 RepID=A0A371YYX7_9PROT|nr:hypothetical protein [Komagataeibacter melaceti]RFD19436.1 hypothetical protein DY926_11360 [Komagataeibacter melaceti]